MRVVHLCDYASAYPGSFVPLLQATARAVSARGWSFEAVFAPGAQDRDWYTAIQRDGMLVRSRPQLTRRARLRWVRALLAERTSPTILHTHFAGWDLASLAARWPRPGDPTGVVWHRHGVLERRPNPRDVARFGLAGRAVDAHLCVGPGTHAQQLAFRAPPSRTLLFPNPVDVRRFPVAEPHERIRARRELGIEPDVALLVAFTWDWQDKGGPLLLAAARELLRRGRHFRLLLVGGGAEAQQALQRSGLEGQACIVAPREDPQVLFAAAEVFVAPSPAEAFGFAPHEAVCCGTPAVVSDVPGHRYYGAQLPAMRLTALDPSAFADAIEAELTADQGDRAARAARSRSYLELHASVGAWTDRLLEVYDQVLARRIHRRASDRSCS